MTLNVSLCVPDGIIIASDSLATLNESVNKRVNVDSKCPKCSEDIQLKDVQIPPFAVPASSFPYAQKLFSIRNKLGLTIHGAGHLNGRSMYSLITDLEAKLPKTIDAPDYMDVVKQSFIEYFDNQIKLECAKTGFNIALQPDTWMPFGFQLVGFAKDANGEPVPKVYWIKMGKNPAAQQMNPSVFCTGDTTVVNMLFPGGVLTANVGVFSLQDAIDYAKFLIRTTSEYQRFSGKWQTVGGDIDIALITNRNGFQWIAQKPLYKILERPI
ncbi:MAG: hypothetical protein ABSA83_20220 [Verrucomicrobiota bacterium]